MRAPPRIARALIVGILGVACSPAAPQPKGQDSAEIDLSKPSEARPDPFSGLAPCGKDAAPGEGCARGPAAAPPAKAQAAAAPVDDRTVWRVWIDGDDPVLGPPDALVTVVVFSDFECPFCRRTAGTLHELLAEYPADVRLVWKDLPLPMHANAQPAAELARSVLAAKGAPGFWAAHDMLYESQAELGPALFRRIARKLGVPWSPERSAGRYGVIFKKISDLSDRVLVEATPTTYLNGRRVVGAQPYGTYRDLVEELLPAARARVAAGTPRAGLYDELVRGGREVAPPTDLPTEPGPVSP